MGKPENLKPPLAGHRSDWKFWYRNRMKDQKKKNKKNKRAPVPVFWRNGSIEESSEAGGCLASVEKSFGDWR